MARDFFINGESLVYVKGRADSSIGTLSELGLASGPIVISPVFNHRAINVNAWGEAPAEMQFMLSEVRVTMTLIHFDRTIMDVCITESMAGAPAIGQLPRAGARMGNNLARFAAGGALGNHYIGLNIASPVGSKPWRFYYAFLAERPLEMPLGAERSAVITNWRAIPYTQDPWGGGTGAQGAVIWDHTLDQ
jgi:hypothetical protein